MKKRTFVRRLLASTTAAVMLLSTVSAMAAFRDTAGHWAEKTLTEWQEQGLIDGYSDGSFQPDGTMTRAGFAKLMNRSLGFTEEAPISFTDVKEGDWFYAEAAKAVAAGYAQGSGGAFRPRQAITRAQAAAMIARAVGLPDNEARAEGFTDAASIPAWAKGSIGAVAEAGFMGGYADGAFRADGLITRAQAVVTLDRVLKSVKKTTIEKAGTTLENETILGDLIIAESVGEGNVTLKNVTVLGSVIVKGGGANSVYFDSVRVGGTVRLQKENVHLRLTGDTALDRVEIGLPCRITQDGSFKGALGALVIDPEKASNQKIQIEVPAKLVELLGRANVALNADVETLQIDKNAEGAQLDIKRGTTVGELSIDARVALTGSGTVVSLVVSVNGVTVGGTLTVEKTGTTDGAKAPTVSGGGSGSSGGSGGSGGGSYTPVKRVTGAETAADVTVPYGTSEADAMSRFPGSITLNVTEGGKAGTVGAAVSWALDKAYSANPLADTVYNVTGTVTIPNGYTYDGTLTVTAKLTVEAAPDTTVTSISEVTGLELPNGAVESDVRLPTLVTVETQKGATLTAEVRWTLDGAWASPGVNTYKGVVTMPAGHYYNGEMNADITTTVTVVESGVTPKTKLAVNHVPLPLTSVGYASTVELALAAARQEGLPTDVLLQCQDDSYIAAVVPANDWRFTYTTYYPNPAVDQTVSLSADVALPMGYDDENGTIRVYCSLEIKKLDTVALDSALTAAKAQLDALTDSEDAAFADSTKIYVAPDNTSADKVTKDVKFIERSQTTALEDAYAAAQSKKNSDTFASQLECDGLAQNLQAKTDALGKITPGVGTFYTNALLLEAVKNGGAINPKYSSEFAYSTEMQPLRNGYTYWLNGNSGWTLPDSDVTVRVDWSFSGDGAQYLAFATEGGRDHKNYLHSYGVKVTGQPNAPQKVTITATVTRYDLDPNGTEVGKIDYTATIGAPIQVDTAATVAEPQMTSGEKINDISLRVPLTDVGHITGVDISKIQIEGYHPSADSGSTNASVNVVERKSGKVKANGLYLSITATCGTMPVKLAPTSSGNEPADPVNSPGEFHITIPSDALTVDESSGWYAPENDLTYTAKVLCCNPAVTVELHSADEGKQTVSVQIEYAYKNFIGAVAFATENSAEGARDAERKVRFNAGDWENGSEHDLITCTKANEPIALEKGVTYYIWCNFSGNFDGDSLSTPGDWMNTGKATSIPNDGETP